MIAPKQNTTSQHRQLWAVIPASGIGARMGVGIPKQYLLLCGKTILEHTLHKISQVENLSGIVLVLDANDQYWPTLNCNSISNLHVVNGGASRAQSVKNGLSYIAKKIANNTANNTGQDQEVKVLVHDAARPCVNVKNIETLVASCEQANQGGILAAPVADTVKRALAQRETPAVQATVDRSLLWLAHTPQYFELHCLLNALNHCEQAGLEVTDEASAIEQTGGQVLLVADGKDNIKITLPEDMLVAEAILANQLKQGT